MKKVGLFLVLCVMFSSCSQQQGAIQDTNSGTTGDVETKVIENLGDVMSQIPEKYLKIEGFNTCVKQSTDNCIADASSEQEDFIVSCDDFLLEVNRSLCAQSETSIKAVGEKNISLCDSLESGKESCEYEVAVAIGLTDFDVTICESLQDVYKVSCNNQIVANQAQIEKDAKICSKILSENEDENSEKEFCIEEVEYIIQESEMMEKERIAQEKLELENQ